MIQLQPNGNIPNNPKLPLLVYEQVFAAQEDLVQQFKKTFARHNWRGAWVNGVFGYHHYHSTAHEVLGIAGSSAVLVLGGPEGKELVVKAGDMLVLPAGTGHCLKSAEAGFKVVGAYPAGQDDYDLCTDEDDVNEKKKAIATVPLPASDPVGGSLLQHWR